MTSDRNQFEELFPEAYRNFEVEELFADLSKSLKKDHIKAALLGKLCHYSREETAKKIGFALGTITRDLSDTVYPAIEQLLQLENEIDWKKADLFQLLEKYKKSFKDSLSVNIPWQQVCREVLEEQQKQYLTSYPLGFGLRKIPEMYVPLELVERDQQEKLRISSELDPERWSVRESEKRTAISNQEFFQQVSQGKSPKSNSKRIAVIGEPGAGKTTLLQKIASEVKELPIWIDLADIGTEKHQSLEDYLLETWLTRWALRTIRKLCPEASPSFLTATEELKNALAEEFEKGHVCLLLDGADEMAAKFGQPLIWIEQKLRGSWITEAKVVLSCRLNLWSIEGDYLPNFDVYRNLDFSDEQVEEFIEKWFANEPDSCRKLKEERNLANERIKKLIRNPLRLTLLCLTWKKGGEKLPDTKAGLYQRLVEGHYNWKREREGFALLPEEQKKLNQWLGELAKDALDSKESRFRLRKSSIESFLAKHNQDSSLWELAIKLGWLIEIGLPSEDEKDADEPVYAFFHPTFQEYFAALAINDWDFFLNHVPENPTQGNYRIFESQWKEVILLWLGRSDKKDSPKYKDQKEEFIRKLLEFDKVCDQFHRHRSYCLAASGIQEFPDYPLLEQRKIVNEIVNWNLNLNNSDFRSTLLETNRQIAIEYLLEETIQPDRMNYKALKNAFEILNLIGKSNTYAVKKITSLMSVLEERLMYILCIFSEYNNNFQKYSTIYTIEKKQQFIDALIYIEYILIKYADSLGKIAETFPPAPAHKKAISTLLQIIFFNNCEFNSQNALKSLIIIGTGSYEEIEVLEHLINTTKNELTRIEAIDCLGKLNPNHPLVIPELLKFIETIENELIREEPGIIQLNEDRKYYILEKALKRLEEMAHSNLEVIPKLINFVMSSNNELSRRDLIKCFNSIGKENSKIINCLQSILSSTTDEDTIIITAKVLGTINKGNSLAIDKLVNFIEFTRDEQICISAINSLGEIGAGNVKAVNALNEAIKTKNDFMLVQVTYNLWKIAPENSEIIPKLEQIISNNKTTDHIRWVAADKLGEINRGNRKAVDTLLQLMLKLTSLKNKNRCIKAAFSLTKVLQNEQLGEMVTILRDYFLDDNSENFVNRSMACYKVLSHCSQKMKYQDFYHAWYKSTTTHPEAPANILVGNSNSQNLPLAQKIQIIQATVASDTNFKDAVKLICIDGSYFSDLNNHNPAIDIYIEMVEQGCPEKQEEPNTMQQLKKYWRLNLRKLEKQVALLFYNSKSDRTLNPSFLSDISTFGGTIAIISDEHCNNVRLISPNDSNFIDTVLKWLKREIKEA